MRDALDPGNGGVDSDRDVAEANEWFHNEIESRGYIAAAKQQHATSAYDRFEVTEVEDSFNSPSYQERPNFRVLGDGSVVLNIISQLSTASYS